MQCRKCGKEIEGEAYRMVAQWSFCLECFEELLNKPSEEPATQPPREEPPSAPVGPAPTPSVASAPEHPVASTEHACMLCTRAIPAGDEQWLASWVFCPSCFGALVSTPEEEPAAPRPKKTLGELLDPPTYVKPTTCDGCGRRLPPGAGKELDGALYCPDCHRARAVAAGTGTEPPARVKVEARIVPQVEARIVPQVEARIVPQVEARPEIPARVTIRARVDDAPRAATGRVCESCGREASPASLQTMEGFEICRACLTTDADLAVHLARKRHQLHLERLKNELT